MSRKKHSKTTNNQGPETNKRLALEKRRAYQEKGLQKAREKKPLYQIGCMLYWAEGSKYMRTKMDFANSDPVMHQVFIRFLREELLIHDEIIKIRIHCHTQDEEEISRIKHFWLDILQLPEAILERINYKQGSDKSINRLLNGVCSICVYRVEIVQHIFGAIQEYGGFVNEEWLY
jgi:hypothetical protein